MDRQGTITFLVQLQLTPGTTDLNQHLLPACSFQIGPQAYQIPPPLAHAPSPQPPMEQIPQVNIIPPPPLGPIAHEGPQHAATPTAEQTVEPPMEQIPQVNIIPPPPLGPVAQGGPQHAATPLAEQTVEQTVEHIQVNMVPLPPPGPVAQGGPQNAATPPVYTDYYYGYDVPNTGEQQDPAHTTEVESLRAEVQRLRGMLNAQR